MRSDRIIKPLDINENLRAGLRTGLVLLMMTPFIIKGTKEAFHDSIIIAIGLAAHAYLNSIDCQEIANLIAGILTAAIRVMDEPKPRLMLVQSHAQCLFH